MHHHGYFMINMTSRKKKWFLNKPSWSDLFILIDSTWWKFLVGTFCIFFIFWPFLPMYTCVLNVILMVIYLLAQSLCWTCVRILVQCYWIYKYNRYNMYLLILTRQGLLNVEGNMSHKHAIVFCMVQNFESVCFYLIFLGCFLLDVQFFQYHSPLLTPPPNPR